MRHWFFLTAFLLAPFLSAQHIGYMIPAGGQPGTTVEVLIGGQQFWSIKNVRISGTGVSVESVTPVPGIPNIGGKQWKFVTGWMRNIVTGKKEIPPKPPQEEIDKDWRKHKYFDIIDQLSPLQFHLLAVHLFVPRNPLQMSPAINSNLIVKLKIDADAKPGIRYLRLVRSNFQASNPLPFYVDPLPVVREPFLPIPPQKRRKYEFTLPAVINGQIMPGETDIWHFKAQKGEKLVFHAFARSMIPFMGDCVPGYFQCLLDLRDSRGSRVAFADDNGFDPDPVLCCTIPEDGEYALHVRDSLYRGRADFVYRIRAYRGDPPEFKIQPPDLKLPLKKNAASAKPVKVDFPVLIQGCIAKPGQQDSFVIHAQKDQAIVGEVFARRQGSRLDSRLTVFGPDGKKVAFNDDYKRFLAGPVLQHTDSYLCFRAPQTGDYTFVIADTAGNGSTKHCYFLRIDQPRPSFNLYVAPSYKMIAPNYANPLKIHVEPLDGFDQDIHLRVKAPNGYVISGSNIIPAGVRDTVIAVTCPDRSRQLVSAELIAEYELPPEPGQCCCCRCGVRKGRGKVFYGDEETQAFAYTHLVLSPEWLLSKGWGPAGFTFIVPFNHQFRRLKINAGETAQLKFRCRKLPKNTDMTFGLRNPPKGLTLLKTESRELKKGWNEVVLTFQVDKNMKSSRFNQVVTAVYSYLTRPNKQGKVFQRKSEFILPPVLFEITGD